MPTRHRVRLSHDVWINKILVSHPEFASDPGYEEEVRLTLEVPEFVVEVMSPSDHLKAAQAKMETWIANGVQLGWLIDGDAHTVYIYRKGRPPRTRRDIAELAGEGPVKGFTLNLKPIWAGL